MATGAAIALSGIPGLPERDMEIVDTHQHLWDLKQLQLPWLPTSGPLAGDHLMSDYLRESVGLGIRRTVYMEVDVTPEQHVREAEYALALCGKRGSPMVGAVIGGRPAAPGFGAYVGRLAGKRAVKGVRQVLHSAQTPQGFCVRPEFLQGVRLLGQHGLVFDVCLPAAYLEDAVRLAKECPDTRLVLDHCGNADVQAPDSGAWKRSIDQIAARPNVWCKISGIVATAKPGAWSASDLAPFVLHCAEAFGEDRIVFGSDWPVCTLVSSLREWVTALREIVADWSPERRRKLWSRNAQRAYALDQGRRSPSLGAVPKLRMLE